MRLPDRLCEGLGMQACFECHRNADRHPEAERAPNVRWIRPGANPPRCVDFLPVPVRAINATHGRL